MLDGHHVRPDGHPAATEFWTGTCSAAGSDSVAQLSNGWAPHFTGSGTCAMGFRWELRRRLRKCRAADRLYSGNSYANASYALGVARNSVVVGPGGDLYAVYQAWNAAHDARYPLVDQTRGSMAGRRCRERRR